MEGAGVPGLMAHPAWAFAEQDAGVDLLLRKPANTLPKEHYTKKCPIAVIQGLNDTTVPPSQTKGLVKLLEEHPDGYEIKEKWFQSYTCGPSNHCSLHQAYPEMYRKKLCGFWTGVFGMDEEDCGLDKLPSLWDGKVESSFEA